MAAKDLPSPELLRKLLRYNPETGEMFWLERGIEFFQSARICKTWNARYAGKKAFFRVCKSGYVRGGVLDRKYEAHRVAWALHYGEWPRNHIDHVNGDKTDNRIANLRDVMPGENRLNAARDRRNKSGHSGVCWCKKLGKWHVRVNKNRKTTHIGFFSCLDEAIAARRSAQLAMGFTERHGR